MYEPILEVELGTSVLKLEGFDINRGSSTYHASTMQQGECYWQGQSVVC